MGLCLYMSTDSPMKQNNYFDITLVFCQTATLTIQYPRYFPIHSFYEEPGDEVKSCNEKSAWFEIDRV